MKRYVFTEKPESSHFCWTVHNEWLPQGYQDSANQHEEIPLVYQREEKYSRSVKSRSNQKANSQTLAIDHKVGWEVADWVHQKRSRNRSIDVGRRKIVDDCDFVRDGYDWIVGKTIDEEGETHEREEDRSILFLNKLVGGEFFDHLFFLDVFVGISQVCTHAEPIGIRN